MKRIESLLKIVFKNLEICFHKRQVSFQFVKTAKCKRGISESKSDKMWPVVCFNSFAT